MPFPHLSVCTRLTPEGNLDNSGKTSRRLLQPSPQLSGLLPRAGLASALPLRAHQWGFRCSREQPWELCQVLSLLPHNLSFPLFSPSWPL